MFRTFKAWITRFVRTLTNGRTKRPYLARVELPDRPLPARRGRLAVTYLLPLRRRLELQRIVSLPRVRIGACAPGLEELPGRILRLVGRLGVSRVNRMLTNQVEFTQRRPRRSLSSTSFSPLFTLSVASSPSPHLRTSCASWP